MPLVDNERSVPFSLPDSGSTILRTDPRVVPFPSGSLGQTGCYLRGASGSAAPDLRLEDYVHDGQMWRDSSLMNRHLEFPDMVQPAYFFDADDVDGDDSYNNAYADLAQPLTWKNKGGSGSDITLLTGNNRQFNPSLGKSTWAGRGAWWMSANRTYFTIAGSASVLNTAYTTGLFEWYFLFAPGIDFSSNGNDIPIFSNEAFSNTKCVSLYLTNGGLSIIIGGNGSAVYSGMVGPALTANRLYLIGVWGDGANIYCTIDGSTKTTSALTPANFGSGASNSDFSIGHDSLGSFMAGNLFAVWLSAPASSAGLLSAAARRRVYTEARRLYHF